MGGSCAACNPRRAAGHSVARAQVDEPDLLPLLRPPRVHLDRRAALWAIAGLVSLHRLRFGERHVEFVGFVLGMPAASALDAHPDDHRDAVIHGGSDSAYGSYRCAASGRRCMMSPMVASARAIRVRSSGATGHTTSHSRQYASMLSRDSINFVSARRVYPYCSFCCPHEGQLETKMRGFFMAAPSF